jgi:hypothetical protein
VLPAIASRRRSTLAVALVCGAHLAVALDWGLGEGRSLAPDEITPQRVAAARRAGFAGGWHDYYPPLMFYLAAATGAASDALAGEGRESPASWWRHALALRGVSLAAAVATVVGLLALGRRLGLGVGAAVAALAWAASPTVSYYAKTGNVESLYLFGIVVVLALLARALAEGSAGAFVGAAAAAAAAAAVKDQAAAYGLFAALALAIWAAGGDRAAAARRAKLGAIGGRGFAAAVAVGAALALWLLNVPFNLAGVRGHFEALRTVARLAPEFPADAAGKLAQAWQSAVNLEFVLGAPVLLLAGWGLVAVARDDERRERHGVHLWAAGGYALFMWLALPRAYDRFALPVAISAVLLAGAGADDLLVRFPSRRRLVGVALGAVLAFSAARAVELDLRLRFDSRATIGEWIAADGGSYETTWVLGKHDWAPLGGRRVGLGTPRYFGRLLRRSPPRHLVVEAEWSRSPRWSGVVGAAGFVVVHRDAGRVPARLTRPGGARTNLDKISPELVVYRRAAAEAASRGAS